MTPPPPARSQQTSTQALEYLRLRGYYSTTYTEIVRPERVFAVSHYFRRYWLPLLKPGPAWLVVGLRQRCFWNHQQDWCVVSREQLAAECGISERTLDKYLNLPLISSWFLLETVQRYRYLPDGQKQRDWKRYHVRLDDPLTPLHQAALTLLARELHRECRATTPPAQALEIVEKMLALDASDLGQRLDAAASDPTVQSLAQTLTGPQPLEEIVAGACGLDPATPADRTETAVNLSRACDALYVRIAQPSKRQVASQYFRLNWLPHLGAARAWLIMALRARCYWNEGELTIRDTCTVTGGYRTLAAEVGVSIRTVKACIAEPPGPTFVTRLATRRPGRGRVEIDFQVEMVDPVTPEDQARYADQRAKFAGSPPDQRAKFAGSPDQRAEFAGTEGTTKGQNLRNTKELLRTPPQKENQQQEPAVVVDLPAEQEQALAHLLQIGFQPLSVARQYATAHAPDQILGWCRYAKARGLGAGYVRAMLDAGEVAPAATEPAQLVSPTRPAGDRTSAREQTMQRYGIAPEVMALWERVLTDLRLQMARSTFDAWLHGSLLLSVSPGARRAATIGVRNGQAVDWLRNRLDRVIRRTLARHLDVGVDQVELTFTVL